MVYVHPKTKLLIFDCDGTIADSLPAYRDAWVSVMKQEGLQYRKSDIIKYNGLPTSFILKKICIGVNYKDEKSISRIAEEIAERGYANLHNIRRVAPIVELIKNSYKKLPMIVVSGGIHKNVEKTLDELDILYMFDKIISSDSDHPTKNKKKAFTKIAKEFGVEPRYCHVFEDGVPGLINALKVGMSVTDIRNIDFNVYCE